MLLWDRALVFESHFLVVTQAKHCIALYSAFQCVDQTPKQPLLEIGV